MTQPIETPTSNRNRLVLFGALGVVALLAAILVPKLLLGGGDGGDDLGPPPDASAAPGATTTTTAPEGPAGEAAPEAFSTKNPFTPLVDAAPVAAVPVTPTGETSAVATPPATTPTGTGTSTEPAPAGRFSLVDVYAGPDGAAVATVEVSGRMYTVSQGEAFADGYRVVSLSVENKSGTFTAPDGSTFTPTTGSSVLK